MRWSAGGSAANVFLVSEGLSACSPGVWESLCSLKLHPSEQLLSTERHLLSPPPGPSSSVFPRLLLYSASSSLPVVLMPPLFFVKHARTPSLLASSQIFLERGWARIAICHLQMKKQMLKEVPGP